MADGEGDGIGDEEMGMAAGDDGGGGGVDEECEEECVLGGAGGGLLCGGLRESLIIHDKPFFSEFVNRAVSVYGRLG